jgi:hypothetical protein
LGDENKMQLLGNCVIPDPQEKILRATHHPEVKKYP